MRLAIMQPYFLSYIGYYQLIASVDKFVVYDNIEFTKKGWFNKNRILLNNKEHLFTIPLKHASDFLHVKERFLSDDSIKARKKILSQINNSYRKAPFFSDTSVFIEGIFLQNRQNLFDFIYHSINQICDLLQIKTEIIRSSSLNIDHTLKSEDKVIAINKSLNATTYINAIGGQVLYDKKRFKDESIELVFLKPKLLEYKQFDNTFIPWLSIIDVLMFNSKEQVQDMLHQYNLV
jgi:hypothetical protein